MVMGVQLLKAGARDLCVNLRRGQIGVTEQHLHDAYIGAVVQQVRRKGVPQAVRREGVLNPSDERITLNIVPKRLARERSRAGRNEQHIARPSA